MSASSTHLHLFGIRHHGPGSARSLQAALETLQPDIVLVEGPPEANDILTWLAHPELEPPVALIIYRPDRPQRAVYYPFAVFSPELQAVRYGLAHDLPVRFIDLPQAHQMAMELKVKMPGAGALQRLAEVAGFQHYEQWWNRLVEQRQNSLELFEAILTMMQVVRDEEQARPPADEPERLGRRLAEQREAYMRGCLRQARAEGYQRPAVVCGAWHTPALRNLTGTAADTALLADLPRVAVEAAWVPWTYSRLANASGYGAGITSPGWYHHLWALGQARATPTEIGVGWLTQVAHLLRQEGFDASAAHVIEAVRLAEALAAMRNLPLPGLAEFNEATQTVMCFGDAAPLGLIQEKLIIGERMGAVPPDTPMTPLQRDLYQHQRRLRLRPEPDRTTLKLDLRNDMHRERSHLLHRLRLLNIPWGKPLAVRGKQGTFREVWQLQWLPDFAIRVIEANMWGNTIPEAAAAFARHQADQATDLPALTGLLDRLILADLPETITGLMRRLEEEAALSRDIPHMMEALPPLARVLRYGSVRQTDQAAIRHVVDGLLTRICLGLPNTCASLDDAAAADLLERLVSVNDVVNTLHEETHRRQWHEVLGKLVDQKNLHGLLAGRACRLLLEARVFTREMAVVRLERALMPGAALSAAFWLEGFLKGSGLLLLHDQTLWTLLDGWLGQLDEPHFINVLPLLRRTFAGFSASARRQLLERVRPGQTPPPVEPPPEPAFDPEQAGRVLPLVARLLGL